MLQLSYNFVIIKIVHFPLMSPYGAQMERQVDRKSNEKPSLD